MKNLLAILSIGLASLSHAAPSESPDSSRVLDEVVVVETSAKAQVALLPLDVRVIDSSTIEQSTESNLLPVLQNRVPGMFVTERGVAGYGVSGDAAGSVSIRGVGGVGRVLFLIDGQPQWAGIFGHALPDTYVTNDVQRVEVVSGPASLLYGSGAMGGSVNIITRRACTPGFAGSLRAIAGSYGTQKYNARASYMQKGWRALAAASYESSLGNRPDMHYWLANQYASLSYDFSPHWQAGANVIITETKAHNPGSTDLPQPLQMWTQVLRSTTALFITNHYDKAYGGLQAYYNYGRHKIDDGLKNGIPRDYLFFSNDYNMGITAYQTLHPWSNSNLSLGFDFKHWGGRARNVLKDGSSVTPVVEKHVNEIAGYAMMQQSLWHQRLSLNAGVRLEHSSQFGNQWVPQAGFIFRPMPSSRLKFNYTKGFRSPNIRELYMYGSRNADLRPESMHNIEAELRWWLLGARLSFGTALYYIHGDNMIQQVMVDGSQRNMNTGQFINKGFELDASFTLNSHWVLLANYAYLHTDTRILAAPRNKLFSEVAYTPGHWQFALNLLGAWGVYTEKTTENYALLGARIAYSLPMSKPLTIFAKGENLTATKYQINYGFPMPGATIMAGIEWKF